MGLPSPPVYPSYMDRWITPRTPLSGAADITAIPCQKYVTPYVQQTYVTFAVNGFYLTTLIKTPPGIYVFNRGDILEVTSKPGEYYLVCYKEDFYLQFASWFEGLLVFQCNANGSTPRTY